MFWNQLNCILAGIADGEELIVVGDLNRHAGRDREGMECWHGGLTIGWRNEEGEQVLEITQT